MAISFQGGCVGTVGGGEGDWGEEIPEAAKDECLVLM